MRACPLCGLPGGADFSHVCVLGDSTAPVQPMPVLTGSSLLAVQLAAAEARVAWLEAAFAQVQKVWTDAERQYRVDGWEQIADEVARVGRRCSALVEKPRADSTRLDGRS